MRTIFNSYLNTFKGLSKEVWWLALITLINRAGTMVIPFLSLYLNESLSFSLKQIGWVMTCYGLGSVVGSWTGGKLADKVGFYKVMKISLFLTGVLFIALQYTTQYTHFCLGIFLVMLVADSFRPALFVAMSAYSKPENKTRSVTLIRLAINLGFSAGPFVGGLIITYLSYKGLFWVDGVTCILATLLFVTVLNPKKAKVLDVEKADNPISIFSDKAFWIFFASIVSFGFIFFQYFSTVPIFYKKVHILSEAQIGAVMGITGLLVFLIEMPLVKWLEDTKCNKILLIVLGLFLTGVSFLAMTFTNNNEIIILITLLMVFGEMIFFPFSNAFILERSTRGKRGEYMGFYTLGFSVAHIFSHNAGMQLIDTISYNPTWYIMFGVSGLGILLLLLLKVIVKKEELETTQVLQS